MPWSSQSAISREPLPFVYKRTQSSAQRFQDGSVPEMIGSQAVAFHYFGWLLRDRIVGEAGSACF